MDAEFVEYVRARQQTLLRAAYLVCGDAGLAERLVRTALVRLARQWDEVRDEQPDAVVRRVLYRDAVASWRRREALHGGTAPAGEEGATETWESEDIERRLEVMRALGTLTPRQRAVVVLRHFEERSDEEAADVLGCSVAVVREEADDALLRLRAALPRADLGTGGER